MMRGGNDQKRRCFYTCFDRLHSNGSKKKETRAPVAEEAAAAVERVLEAIPVVLWAVSIRWAPH